MSTRKAGASSSRKAKVANLERIRNNQRRSRARRKEYMTQLENKLHDFENSNGQWFTNTKLEQITAENELLKRLLLSLGLDNDFLKSYSNASQVASEISRVQPSNENCGQADCSSSCCPSLNVVQPDPMPNIIQQLDSNNLSLPSGSNLGHLVQEPLLFFDNSIQADSFFQRELSDFPTNQILSSDSPQTQVHTQPSIQSAIDSLMTEASARAMLPSDTSKATTHCSLAFSLVLKNNMKGYTAAELDIRLRVGYRCGATAADECRIDNKTLFDVLAEIS